MSPEPLICGFLEARHGRSWDFRGTSDAPDAGCQAWGSLTGAVRRCGEGTCGNGTVLLPIYLPIHE